jgi:hypothetical protein
VRQKRASLDIEPGRRLLEEKLRIYTQAGAQPRRNLALDFLTGGGADDHPASAGLGVVAATPLYAFAHAGAMAAPVRADNPALHPVGEREPKIVMRTPARRVERRRADQAQDTRERGMPRVVPLALFAIVVVGGVITVRSLLDGGAHADASQAPAGEATSVATMAPVGGSAQPASSAAVEPTILPTMAVAVVPPVVPAASMTLVTPSAASPAVASRFRTVLDERFADSQRRWPDNPRGTAWLADGSYNLSPREPGRFVAISAPIADTFGDVDVTATFRKTGGPPGGGYGLVLRDQGPGRQDGLAQSGRFFVFEVGDRGELGVWLREGDRWVDLIPWTPSEVVRPGTAQNQVRVTANGENMNFFVNGMLVATGVDTVLRQGTVGIFVGGDLNEVSVERFTVQVPQ